jgi:O-methyltransferase
MYAPVVDVGSDIEPQAVTRLRDLYLELLIGALTHTIYSGSDTMEVPQDLQERLAAHMGNSEEGWMMFHPELARVQGRDWPANAQTMVGLERLRSVRSCVETVLAEGVPGDMIEAGAWRGGVGILIRGILKAYGVDDRFVWVADSFRGLPPAEARDRGVTLQELEWLVVPVEEVRENFYRYGLLDEQVRFVQGWFRDTLPALRQNRWAVVRADGDMYGSTMDVLVNLYDGLSAGGFMIIDDYFGLPPCRDAVDDFRRDRGIEEPIEQIDWTGAFWRKRA